MRMTGVLFRPDTSHHFFSFKGFDQPAQVAFVHGQLRSDLPRGDLIMMIDLVKNANLGQRVAALENMLVEQAYNSSVKAVKSADFAHLRGVHWMKVGN